MFKFISNHTLKSSAFQNLRNNSVSIPKERITSKILFKSLFNGRILPKNKQIQNVFSNSLLRNLLKQNNNIYSKNKFSSLKYYHDMPKIHRHCWKCDSEVDYLSIHCKREDCGVIQNVFPDNVTYFEVLGVGNEIDGR